MSKEIVARQTKMIEIIEGRQDQIAETLREGVTIEKFMRTFKNALISSPNIAECDPSTVYIECQKAAADGLVIDGREAALVTFNASRKVNGNWEKYKACTYIPMIAGVVKRVRSSGQVKTWTTGVVYQQELEDGRFEYEAGENQFLKHKPIIIGERGPLVAAYSIVTLKDGTRDYCVMSMQDIDIIMNRSKSKDKDGNPVGPWRDDKPEMAKKTVMKRHSKTLPIDQDTSDMLARDNDFYEFAETEEGEFAAKDDTPDTISKRKRSSAAAKVKKPAPVSDVSDIDPDTGEIVEDEPQEDEPIEDNGEGSTIDAEDAF
jgi:recombination protein RecT